MPKRTASRTTEARKKATKESSVQKPLDPVCARASNACSGAPIARSPCQLDHAKQPPLIVLCEHHARCDWCHKVVQNHAFLVTRYQSVLCLRSSDAFVARDADDTTLACGFCCAACHDIDDIACAGSAHEDGEKDVYCNECVDTCKLCKESRQGEEFSFSYKKKFVCDECVAVIRDLGPRFTMKIIKK